ncbi:ribosomal subunit interface protein [Pelagivirga sediminicola]|uniref:Ribosomal subunit interface protein n=1 Tax=Pelagivirga sediminicola TaxID=2170575 RepID=A0A2T7GB49_9RHOB|nr:aromatic ring-hydroxylating dioxygenase subunit alpha [Pelagivirga sediminicola]PVA11626.1 ribosomal subunit interface protein [Pelagivirga sediminicola]
MTAIDIAALKASRRPGHALPRPFYTEPAIYEHDIRDYWNRSWIWVGHESQVPEPGDYFTFDYGPESLIIARDRDGGLGAFQNVCRHRGSRVCLEKSGNARVFSCPYHAWTYELTGHLRRAREMPEGFDPAEHGLLAAHLRSVEGLIFVCTAKTPPDIDSGLAQIRPLIAPFDLGATKIAHSATYDVPANWKLAVENYMECYHCGPAHLEFARSHSIKDPAHMTAGLVQALQARSRAAGLPEGEVLRNDAGAATMFCKRYPLFEGYSSGSKTGAPLAPLLGRLAAFDGGATDLQIGILNNFLIYADHMVGYRFIPTALQTTRIEVVWFVRDDAVAGEDYDLADLTWLWHVTSLDDERIIRHNQEGVNSHHFVPGPLSDMEWGISAFYDDYLSVSAP